MSPLDPPPPPDPSFEALAQALSALRQNTGGSKEERRACALVAYALLLFQATQLVKALRREDFEVSLFEDAGRFVVRIGHLSFGAMRFAATHEIVFEFAGFDGRVVPYDRTRQTAEVSATMVEECQRLAKATIDAVGEMVRRDTALRA